jgi:sodium-dependent dicarboxylate transporter 2/3/5
MTQLKQDNRISPKLIALGLVIFFGIILFFDLQPGKSEVTYTAAIAFLMAFLWISEALPLGVTSLLPIVLFPVFGVLDGKDVSSAYFNYVIFLFIGGFIMALAMEKWNLHKRIALKVLSVVGGSPLMILFGFMASSAFLSMWISNTATAMMMLPMVISVTATLEEVHGAEKINSFAVGLLLCIAYACSIGGTATLVGTPPNLSFLRIYEIIFPNAPEISFGQWLLFALPIGILLFFFTLLQLYLIFKPEKNIQILEKSFFKEKYKALGKTTPEEKRVFILFLILALLWVFRSNLNLGYFVIVGWSSLFENPEFINDGTVAIFISVLLFIVPSTEKNKALVSWEIIKKIPWYIVFLLGGGFALAKGFVDSGLSSYIGNLLNGANELSPLTLVASLSGMMTFLTEFTSNTATTEMLLPIIAGLAIEIKVHPLLIMLPVTIAASMAFMLPIATAPNAIAFGTGKIKMKDMIKAGFLINIISIFIITAITLTWGLIVFDIDPLIFPDWAGQVTKVSEDSI